jgi:hypothetical protein
MARLVFLSCVLVLALAGELPAQGTPSRGGFWYAVGFGEGWARVSCPICKAEHQPGLTAHLRLGGAVSRHVVIAGEGAGWRRNTNGVHQTLGAVGAAAYWYPGRRRTPLYLKGGFGYVTHRADDGTDVITSTGFGPQLGIGYEAGISPGLFLTPFLNVAYGTWFGGVKFNGAQAVDQATVTLVQFGIGLTGRP